MSVGKNTVAGKQLSSYIDRIERLDAERVQLGKDISAIAAEAKSNGFNPKTLKKVLQIRKQKPHDREEEDAILQLYLHAIGMDKEAPLFSAVGRMAVDPTVKEQVLDALKQLVPAQGEIIVNTGGSAIRLWRDAKGKVQAEDVQPKPMEPVERRREPIVPARDPESIPQCTPAEAEELGTQAYEENEPITANPFPWDDKRRPRWDKGWRNASGTDGMGPEED